jgi:hypothetical protein
MAGNRRDSATLAAKPDQRKCPVARPGQVFEAFSLEGEQAVRFQGLHWANAMRSETDGSAKANWWLAWQASHKTLALSQE